MSTPTLATDAEAMTAGLAAQTPLPQLHPAVSALMGAGRQQWIESSRAINAERGWGQGFSLDVSPNPVVQWAMIGTEVIELQDELDARGHDRQTPLPGLYTKAEMELADIIVRALDLLGLLQSQGAAPVEAPVAALRGQARQPLVVPAEDLMWLSMAPHRAVQGARKSRDPQIHVAALMAVIERCEALLLQAGADPQDCVRTKLQINAGREWMHGRRY